MLAELPSQAMAASLPWQLGCRWWHAQAQVGQPTLCLAVLCAIGWASVARRLSWQLACRHRLVLPACEVLRASKGKHITSCMLYQLLLPVLERTSLKVHRCCQGPYAVGWCKVYRLSDRPYPGGRLVSHSVPPDQDGASTTATTTNIEHLDNTCIVMYRDWTLRQTLAQRAGAPRVQATAQACLIASTCGVACSGGKWTGAALSPARVLGPLAVFKCGGNVAHVYVLAQLLAALLACSIFAFVSGWGPLSPLQSTKQLSLSWREAVLMWVTGKQPALDQYGLRSGARSSFIQSVHSGNQPLLQLLLKNPVDNHSSIALAYLVPD
eukprot:GHRQ01007976.1.p1 GENE.GHRQ01007976.1~~GHRQ01007976.1.p1  ORF type:complete len:324 (-),score=45.32 GHRQ01007976.1:1372-2343(-)